MAGRFGSQARYKTKMKPKNYQNQNDEEYEPITFRLDSKQADMIEKLMVPEGKFKTLSDVIRAAVHQFAVQNAPKEENNSTVVMQVDFPKGLEAELGKYHDAIHEGIQAAVAEYPSSVAARKETSGKYKEIVDAQGIPDKVYIEIKFV